MSKQAVGKYSVRGHFLRVAPVFAWPPVAWVLHRTVMWLTGWKARRDGARLAAVEARMHKMLSDLKVTVLVWRDRISVAHSAHKVCESDGAEAVLAASAAAALPSRQ